ncbi:MAG: hypothetical protein COZ70_11745 [Deltaproteobacteria bacterium CG_4_8_14_3_um_filter_51_11]|nr:hypothetical protein [bacterium]OIP42489.1 MAG: hypothetical protein AUK25_03715 [Desulfobacteraceae bacterium CG2_30_51_40]PIP45790.1 MAG: hypothetical protein COX16_11420 [Deltaproteobacteria bacterium CG23_combo_of_CG06-09_8_20_14_all_51_20]PIV99700.1 MAG: hypothetical protein COW41_07280 [Deltaproteobacteria bacterium CG17_big_fil_post_rev_8_21_14_2_50_51_6]PIX18907.1 MAG: hypothetical protein COZ70_11745 [Deltaproteobacteria bacterium CG_4_8_14_3_um_filter_51_11]PIY26388.1 MAG: hypothe
MTGYKDDEYFVEDGQAWEADLMRPSDAKGVARLFVSVYGNDYPIRTYLEPERLIAENKSGNIISAVARTTGGQVVGHNAMFKSAPYGGIREAGAGVVHTSYRGGAGIFTKLTELLQTKGAQDFGVEGVHGEPILSHVFSQKMCRSLGWISHAMEVDLMPASAYEKEKSAAGRVSALLDFKTLTPKPHRVHIPACYEMELRFLYSELDDTREIFISTEKPGAESRSRFNTQYFDFAQVARIAVWETGNDFAALLANEEATLLGRGALVIQVWLSLGQPWISEAVEELRRRRYFLGGLLPRWFDHDGILMQKVMQLPNWEGCQVHFDRGRRIFEFVKADWQMSKDRF